MEKDIKKLEELRIKDNGEKKQICPACNAIRKNKKDKSLSVDWDKCIAHCHYCNKSFFFGKTEKIGHEPKTKQEQPKAKEYKKPGKLANEEPLDTNMRQWFIGRGIPAEVAEAEGIFKACRKMPQTGQLEKCIVFPYTVEGELVNRKYRDGAKNFMLEKHHPKLIEKLIGKRFIKGIMKPMEFVAAIEYLSRNFFDILPEEGYRVDTILERAEALVRRKGIRVFILDPYNCLEHQIPHGQSETQYISEFLEKLRSFARRKQVLVVLAAHPVKMKKDPVSGKYPVPTMYDISGSAAFFNKADFGIAIERDRTQGVTRVHVQKVKFRHLGQPGVASFQFNTHCGRFVPIIESKTPDLPNEEPKWDNSNWLVKKLEVNAVQLELDV